MRKRIILLHIFFLISICVNAQQPYKGEVRVNFNDNVQNRETVTLQAEIDLTGIDLRTNEIITFTPALRSLDGVEEITFETISISGKRRARSIRRKAYYERRQAEPSDNFRIVSRRSPAGRIPVEITLPFQKWMVRSQMVVTEQAAGCCNNYRLYADGNDFRLHTGLPNIFPEPYKPQYRIVYMDAPHEEVKLLQETYTAQLNFQVNQTNLLREFGNNARVLSEVDDIITRVKSDPLLTIRRIFVKGYASPEGNTKSNQKLSEGRAQAFVAYLHYRHNFYEADRMITSEGLGEDWAGLQKAVTESSLTDRDRVLDILTNTENPERRKTALKSLSGGRTYKIMLEEMYPPLRRNEYTIEYEVRGFNAQEAQEIFPNRPQLLSLEEMFMIANLYEHDTEEYKQVFDVAARLYPASPIAQFNVAAMEIENGSYDTAIRRLENLTTPDAINNLAIAYWHKGEYETARIYLEQAIEAGSPEAVHNLEEFEKWLETWDE